MTHTTTNRKAPGATINAEGLPTDTTVVDFRSHRATNQSHDGKAITNQIAQLALAGHTVHKGSAGDFTVCKYAMVRYCKDFAELKAFAKQVGVNHG